MPDAVLRLEGVHVSYGALCALADVSFGVAGGGVTVVLGHNGAGKSTLLATIMGVLPGQPGRGAISFEGRRIDRVPTREIVRSGIAWVPEGRRVFPDLTVGENLALGAYVERDRAAVRRAFERVHAWFPLLAERRGQTAGTLSGGEQQMLAIGRALMAEPRLLLLDEPSLGLAPIVARRLFDVVRGLRDEGTTVLLVEQDVRAALAVADHGVVLEGGRVVAWGRAGDLVDNADARSLYMGAPPDPLRS